MNFLVPDAKFGYFCTQKASTTSRYGSLNHPDEMKRTFWKELLWLLIYAAVGLLLTVGVMASVAGAAGDAASGGADASGLFAGGIHWPGLWEMSAPACVLHAIQWAQTILLMMLPPLLWARIYLKVRARDAFGLHAPSAKWVLWVCFVMVASLPLLDALSAACQRLPLPGVLEAAARAQVEAQRAMLVPMLSPSGPLGWLELVLLMAVGTAVGEELMFRGALLRVFRGDFLAQSARSERQEQRNRHLSAVAVGLLFALIHFDLYGLIPRWLLGTFFVYLVYWTGSLWPSVLAHALNNLFAVVEYKIAPDESSEALLGGNLWLVAASATVTVLLFCLVPVLRRGRQASVPGGQS